MADWPSVADIKRRVGITISSPEADADVESARLAAIEVVTDDCTYRAPEAEPVLTFDVPPDLPNRLREAALLLTVRIYKAPDAPHGIAGIFDMAAIKIAREHPEYAELIRGYRADFGIS